MAGAGPEAFVEQIHASGNRCVLTLTGGGSLAIPVLLTVPGASASMLDVAIPYAAAALADRLGGKFDQACSEATARAMAMAAFERARQLTEETPTLLRGVSCTASLATARPKQGAHRLHVAWQSARATVSYSCELLKGKRTRSQEEAIVAEVLLHAVAEACGVSIGAPRQPSDEEPILRREKQPPMEWTELLLGLRESIPIRLEEPPKIIFSGAFNPLHEAHRRMAALALTRCGGPLAMELSVANVDKPPLDFLEIDSRLAALTDYSVLLTRAATFVEKAALAPGATFVVGADTIARIADEKYYDGDQQRRDSAIAGIASRGCRFLVFGRLVGERFVLPSELGLPSQLRQMCDEVPASEFRLDMSSTELRGKS